MIIKELIVTSSSELSNDVIVITFSCESLMTMMMGKMSVIGIASDPFSLPIKSSLFSSSSSADALLMTQIILQMKVITAVAKLHIKDHKNNGAAALKNGPHYGVGRHVAGDCDRNQ